MQIIDHSPLLIPYAISMIRYQKKAARLRRQYEKEGLLVPPVIIMSITSRCNLLCTGCYMHARKEDYALEMSPSLLASIVDQAEEIGVSIIVFAGGEPFVRYEEIIQIAAAHPDLLMPVFTNALLITEDVANTLASYRNIVPMVSFEGSCEETDARRGKGTYDKLLLVCALFLSKRIFFGCSITATRFNLDTITGDAFIKQMIDNGAQVFSYVEYVPMTREAESFALTLIQKEYLVDRIANLNKQYPALFVGFPGNEEYYGGCLAAGRGFIHVSPSGDLEPCPAAPYADANLTKMPLKDALKSEFLQKLRDTPEILTETGGGCALWARREQIQEFISNSSPSELRDLRE